MKILIAGFISLLVILADIIVVEYAQPTLTRGLVMASITIAMGLVDHSLLKSRR